MWAIESCKNDVKNSVGIVKDLLYSDGKYLKTGKVVTERASSKELKARTS